MKKIVGIMGAALVLASSVSAVDFAAKVYMTGDVAGGNIAIEKDEDGELVGATNTHIFKLNAVDQKDADALVLSVNGDKSGANFQFWYNYDGSGEAALKVRSTNLWFKPASMLKVTVGDVSCGTYKEMLHWWKDPLGGSLADWGSWAAKYRSYATVEGAGIAIEATPIAGLTITAGMTPGAGSTFATIADTELSTMAYGLSAKYDNIAGLPLSAAVSWMDEGNKREIKDWEVDGKTGTQYFNTLNPKILAVGCDYGNAWAPGFYGFLNARIRFEQDATDEKTSIKVAGVTFDNYVKYSAGALSVEGRFPVTMRTAFEATDPTYMSWSAKVKYGLTGFTPYFLVGSDLDNDGAWVFNGDEENENTFIDTMNFEIQPGVTLNVGSCSIDIAARVNLASPIGKKDISWSVPFELGVAF